MSSSDRAVVEVFELTSALGIGGRIRVEMMAEPERAVAVLRHASSSSKIRNAAGFAIANWSSGFDPRPETVEDELAEAGPPDLAAIEHAWSLQPSPVADALLRAMAAALSRYGGFKPLQRALLEARDPDAT